MPNINPIGKKLPLPNAEVIFYPRLFQPPESTQLLTELLNQIEWKQN